MPNVQGTMFRERFRRHPRRYVALGGGATGLVLVAAATGIASATGSAASASTYNFGSGYSAIDGTFTSVAANWIQPTATGTIGQTGPLPTAMGLPRFITPGGRCIRQSECR